MSTGCTSAAGGGSTPPSLLARCPGPTTNGLAGVATAQGRPKRAAQLFGAVEALSEKMGVEVSWSAWRTLNERDLATTRGKLGEETFEAAWAEGRAMTFEQAVARPRG